MTEDKQRTITQNNALHKYFELLAEALNESGQDMRIVLKPEVEISWSKESVKEYIWRPIQKAYKVKDSTTELTTKDIDAIYDIVNKALGERTGVHVPFPSVENTFEYK